MAAAPRVMIVAGEVSGDQEGALLARALRQQRPNLEIAGVGGPQMAAAGVEILVESLRWGLIGYVEAYVRLPVFALRFWRLVRVINRYRPQLLVLVDFAGMNRELVRHFSGRVPMVYFVPPQTTFRRGASAARMARAAVTLLTVLPFETETYRRAGADVVFVGHPAVDTVAAAAATPIERLRAELGIPSARIIGLLPGSRVQEIRRLLPRMLAGVRGVCADRAVRCLVPVASPFLRSEVDRAAASAGVPLTLIEGRALDVMRLADVIIVASGTASVEAACVGVPMIVVYRLSRLTTWIGTRFVATPEVFQIGFSIPNIVMGRRVVPELLNDEVSGPRIRAEVERLLGDPALRDRMRGDLDEVRRRLGSPGVMDRAVAETLRVLDSAPRGTLR